MATGLSSGPWAAVAEHFGAVVLHDDSDVDHIAAVTGQLTRWVVPRGSVG